MTQSQRAKKAEQLRLAAQIIETGAEWETFSILGHKWMVLSDITDLVEAIRLGYEIRIKEPAVIPVPVAKPRVPLEPCDVPPGSVIRSKTFDPGVFCLILNQGNHGVVIVNHFQEIEFIHWNDLLDGGWQIKRPTDTEWQPASKEAP